ncbi:MAG: hypothetical protein L6R43_11090 [Planctomycetes bacterium]|nr:hypothetical protein [Planctomycetota bacterium]
MRRPLRRALLPAALLCGAASAALAAPEGPVPPPVGPGGKSLEEQALEISRRITRDLRENEEALTRLARGEKATPRKVDIEIPPAKEGESSSTPPSGGT